MQSKSNINKLTCCLVASVLAVSLLPTASLGSVSRAWADDGLQAAKVSDLGMILSNQAAKATNLNDGQTDIYGLFYGDGTFIIQKGSESRNGQASEKVISLDERLRFDDQYQEAASIFLPLGKDIGYISKIVISDYIRPNTLKLFFGSRTEGLEAPSSLQCIDGLDNLDASDAASMAGMFRNCSKLQSVDLSSLHTPNAESMSTMFDGCSSLRSVILPSLRTNKVESFRNMFLGCSKLSDVDFSAFDTSNAASMYGMFSGCSSLQELDLAQFNTAKVNSMDEMFSGCVNLRRLDISGFDTSSVVSMRSMFAGCRNLRTLDLSTFSTSKVEDMNSMFAELATLESLDLSAFDTSNVSDMSHMFEGCTNVKSLNLTSFNTKYVVNMRSMFEGCRSLQSVDCSSFNAGLVEDTSSMFYGCSSLLLLDLSDFGSVSATHVNSMFSGCSSLQSLDLSGLDTSNAIEMTCMFSSCSSLKTLDCSSFNTSNTRRMVGMFDGCSSLQTLDLSGFDTSNVTDMESMFRNCSSLQFLDLSAFDTLSVQGMRFMFYGCPSLQSLDLSGFDTSNVTDMESMFYGCSSLHTLDISSFDTSAVYAPHLSDTFRGCSSLIRVGFSDRYVTNLEVQAISLPFLSDYQWTNSVGEIFSSGDIPQHVADTYTAVNPNGNEWAFAPSCGSFIYDGADHVGIKGEENCAISGTVSAIDAGVYEATATPNEGAVWPDGSNGPKAIQWSIFPASAKLEVPATRCKLELGASRDVRVSYIGDGTLSCSAGDPSIAKVSYLDGMLVITPVAAGSTIVTLKVAAGKNYRAATKQMTITVVDPDQLVPTRPPKANSGLVYNQKVQTGVASTPETAVSNGSATNAGEYIAIVTPREGYCWQDGSTGPVEIPWAISKCPAQLSAPSAITLCQGDSLTRVNVSYSGDGLISVNSSNPEAVVASYQNGVLYLSPVGLGVASVLLQATSGQNYSASTKTIDVYVVATGSNPNQPGNGSDTTMPSRPSIDSSATIPQPSKLTSLAKAAVAVPSKVFTGKTLKPSSVTVVLRGKKLRKGVDYTFSCSGGKKVGSYAVAVIGKGSYAGMAKGAFQITPKGNGIKSLKVGKKALSISWKRPTKSNLAQMTGYQIRYSISGKFTEKTTKMKTVSGSKKTSCKLRSLKSGKKYYVQLRTYKKVGGKMIFSTWSKSKAAKVR